MENRLENVGRIITSYRPKSMKAKELKYCYQVQEGDNIVTYQVIRVNPYTGADGERIEGYMFTKALAPVDIYVFDFKNKSKWMTSEEFDNFLLDDEAQYSEGENEYITSLEFGEYWGKELKRDSWPEIFYVINC